jgi:hypothetical protein
MDLQEECGGMDWIELAQERDIGRVHVNTVIISGFIKYGEFLDWLRNC